MLTIARDFTVEADPENDGFSRITAEVDGQVEILARKLDNDMVETVQAWMDAVRPHEANTAGWFYVRDGWGYPPSGSMEKLYTLLTEFDSENQERLKLGFPSHVSAYWMFHRVRQGTNFLRLRAAEKV
jgi:hypothetical protein